MNAAVHFAGRTEWRIRALVDEAGQPHAGLDVVLVIDTEALTVIDAIERAAAWDGDDG